MTPLPTDPTRKSPSSPTSSTKEASARPQLAVLPLEDRVVPAGQVVGTVFLDFNANGLLDPAGALANAGTGSTPTRADAGVGGVVVTAYDSANAAQGAATSAANGSYTLALLNTGPYRLEFTSLPGNLFAGPEASGATGSGTTVQFVADNPPATPINLSLVLPTDSSATNPNLLSNIYVLGENSGATVVRFAYNSGTANADATVGNYALNAPTSVADNTVVGATWGLAFDTANNRAYAAALTKRHTAFGIGGPGAIYTVDPTGATAPTLFANLNALVGSTVAGTNFRGALGTGYNYNTDAAAFDRVGKSGLGGLAVDDTGTFMYTVGLADRKLYRIRIPASGAAPTAADVTAFNIPLPATVTGVGGANGPNGDLRPFAVEFHNGVIYVGAVNSAETTGLAADLRAYVFAFNPASSGGPAFVNLAGAGTTTEAVFSQLLNYPRGFAHIGDTSPSTPATQIQAEWNAWTNTPITLANTAGGERYAIYPQPELTGLAFDGNGTLTLGLRDRNGDQYGNFLTTDFAGTPAPGTKGISAGDTLRATIVTPGNLNSGWTAENITAQPPANITGPTAGGQFFWQQDLPPNQQPTVDDHQALSDGGVLQLPGSTQVLVTGFDPIHLSGQYDLGGVRWFDTTGANAGGINKAFQVYQNSPTSFAKANGIGDLIAAAPLGREIGNRVWNDANGNGRQDPGEAGIQNVSVVLCQVIGGVSTPIATAATDANGNYYFSSYSGTSTGSKRFGVSQIGGLIPAGTSYEVCIPVADAALAGLQLSPFQAAGTNAQNNSDGIASGSNYLIRNVATQRNGTAQHGNDIGFLVASASLSGVVYEDSNPSNTFNAGDAPLAGVTVVLTGTTGSGPITPLTTTTAADGSYTFGSLQPGTYAVTETQPAGFLNRGEQPGSTGGTAPQNGTVISAIPLASQANSASNNFGEVRPVQLSGFVYEDVNNDGTRNGGDLPLAGVTVVLTGTTDLGAAITPQTTTTAADGSYSFTALRPGTYSVTETQPANFTTRTNNPGTSFAPGTGTAGTVAGDVIQTVVLNSNANSPANNFGEIRTANAQLSGFVYEDNDRSSTRNAGDTPIQGVTVVLTGTPTAGGTITPRTTTTAADGSYAFTALIPGNYTVTETQPGGFLDFNDQIGSTGGTVANDVLSAIPIDNAGNANSVANNFGEVRPVQLSGFVYHDVNNDGTRNGGDAAIGGVTVVLTGTTDLGAAIAPQTTTTASDGSYSFTALRPGDYTVSETQPAGFTTRTNNPGTVFTPGTGTAGTVVGDAIQTIRLNSNANSPANNFGEVLPSTAQLSGFVYEDNDRSSSFNAGDTPIAGTTVVLTGTLSTGGAITPRTTTTDGGGAYAFTSLQPGTYQVNETQPAGFLDFNDQIGSTGGTAGNDVLSVIPLATGQASVSNNFGEVRPVQLSGFVYHDINNDGTRNGGDAAIGGVTVVLTGTDDRGAAVTPQTTTTAADGSYSFTALRPGDYTVSETQPAGFTTRTNNPGTVFTPGTGTAGTVVGDAIQTIRLNSNANSPANNFGEILSANAQLSGFVYIDANNDGTFQGGETPIAGTTVVLTGTLSTGGAAIPRTTTTAADGSYAFTALLPGTYSVQELQPTTPANLLTGKNTAGTATTNGTNGTAGAVGDDNIRTVVLNSFGNSPANNFGEVVGAQLAGTVYEDVNNNGAFDSGTDAPLVAVTLVLTGTDDLGSVTRTSVTAADGSYSFAALRPGTYAVTETQPAGYLNRTNTAGATTNGTAGTVAGDVIQTVVLNSSGNSPGNNYGEVRPVQLSGFVYHDANNDGTFNAGDLPLAGVTVVLTGTTDLGAAITPVTSTTAADGSYSFTALRPGTYSVAETQPANFTTRTNNPGTVFTPGTGTAGTVAGDVIQTVVLNSNANSPANNFGEVLTANAQLSGFVYEDLNDSNSLTPALDRPIAGVTVVLTGTLSTGGAAAPLTTTTAADGSYAFTALLPGTYTVTETQPGGFLNRGEQPGSTGGTAPQNGTVISAIPLVSQANSASNNFGEVRPVALAGNVYHDKNNNGVFDAGDVLIPLTTLTLTGTTDLGTAVSLTQVTGGGAYAFTGLRPGTYSVAETQPAGFTTRTNNPGPAYNGTPGTVSGDNIQTVVLRSDGSSPDNNFGEIVPADAVLSGFVYRDPNLNGAREPGNGNEPGLAGVTVKLFREDGPGVLTQVGQAQTDANGFYSFSGLTPGLYRLVETQPVGFYSTKDAAGTTGGNAPGNNTITTIPLAASQNSANNNFGEVPRTNLFGYVWVDANRNGVFDPGEAPIPGTVVAVGGTAFTNSTISQPLTSGLAQGPLTAVTDANGRWDFLSLPPGTYNLTQTNTPAGLSDFRSQNASGQTVQSSTATTFGGVSAVDPAQGPLNFGKVSTSPPPVPQEASKQNFLGSSVLTSSSAPSNPLVGPSTGAVNTTPPFGIGTGGTTPAYVAVGAGAGFAPVVRVFDYATRTEKFRIQAFEDGMTAGVRVTTGDINGDGVPDIIATAGPGAGPRVRVFDGTTGTAIRDFYAFPPDFRGGVYVAVADFNGDGKADIVCGAGEGGGPNVRVFDGATGTLLTSFYAFDPSQTGGARVAVGDFNGDGVPDIAASNGPGNTSLVRVFSGKGFGQVAQYTPYSATYTGGVFLAAGDLDGDGKAELVTGADQGGGPNVRTFDALTGQLRNSFFAYESTFTGGVRVTVRDITGDGKADIITGAGIGGASRLRVFSGATLLPVEEFYAFDSGVRTGVYLG